MGAAARQQHRDSSAHRAQAAAQEPKAPAQADKAKQPANSDALERITCSCGRKVHELGLAQHFRDYPAHQIQDMDQEPKPIKTQPQDNGNNQPEKKSPKQRVACSCGLMIHEAGLEQHARDSQSHRLRLEAQKSKPAQDQPKTGEPQKVTESGSKKRVECSCGKKIHEAGLEQHTRDSPLHRPAAVPKDPKPVDKKQPDENSNTAEKSRSKKHIDCSCGRKVRTEEGLEQHIRDCPKHHPQAKLQEPTPSKEQLIPKNEQKPTENKSKKRVKCSCGQMFRKEDDLEQHVRDAPQHRPKITDSKGPAPAVTETNYEDKEKEPARPEKRIRCSCGGKFKNDVDLEQHVRDAPQHRSGTNPKEQKQPNQDNSTSKNSSEKVQSPKRFLGKKLDGQSVLGKHKLTSSQHSQPGAGSANATEDTAEDSLSDDDSEWVSSP